MTPGSTPHNPSGQHQTRSVIGADIRIKGEVTGGQDMLIEGRLEGRLSLTGCSVTVGKEGRVMADMSAAVIRIDGVVEGTLHGEGKILLSKTGRVKGKIVAPRVVLEEGSSIKGTVDMGENTKASAE